MTSAPEIEKDAGAATSVTPSEDLATILSQLPGSGAEDDVTRVMELYEAGERSYRAGMQAGLPHIGSSASSNP